MTLLIGTGCSEPQYLDDAPVDGMRSRGVDAQAASEGGMHDAALPEMPLDATLAPSPSLQDAGAAPEPSIPAWALPLLGRYAARSHSFWLDNYGTISSVEELALADFVRDGETMIMRTQLCRQLTTIPALSLDLLEPDAFPVLARKLSFEADRFRTDAEPIGTGYVRGGVAACAGKSGQFVPKVEPQPWIKGTTCRCPSSIEEAPRLDDCRVTDPDADGAPGLSYRWESPLAGALSLNSSLVSVVRTQHVRGRVEPSGTHFAELRVDEVAYQLACQPPTCRDVSRLARPCTSELNGTHFVPLAGRAEPPEGWTCTSLRAAEETLFGHPFPTPPKTCMREVLTDDPERR